mgnify:CR=1 FL=1
MYLKLLWRSVARSVLKQSEFCWALLKCQLLHNAFPHSPLLSSSQLQCWSLCKDQKKNVIVRTQNFCYRVNNKVWSRVLVLISKLSWTPCMYVILEFFAQNWFRTIYNSSLKSRLYSHFVFSQVEYHLLPLLWLNLVQLVPYCHIALFILKLAPIIIKTLFCFKKLTCSCLYDHRRTWFVFCGHQNHLVLDRVYIDILGHKTWHKSRNPAK